MGMAIIAINPIGNASPDFLRTVQPPIRACGVEGTPPDANRSKRTETCGNFLGSRLYYERGGVVIISLSASRSSLTPPEWQYRHSFAHLRRFSAE